MGSADGSNKVGLMRRQCVLEGPRLPTQYIRVLLGGEPAATLSGRQDWPRDELKIPVADFFGIRRFP